MAIFDETKLDDPNEWRTFQLFRYGPINLFHKMNLLENVIDYLNHQKYIVHEFDCKDYKTDNAILWDIGLRLNFPYSEGWNPGLDGFNDFLRDVEVPQQTGFVFALKYFDSFHKNFPFYGQHFLEIIAEHYHQNLLFGRRFTALIQLDDGLMQFSPVGAFTPQWNEKEWLIKSRTP